ncbi:MAG TPA: tRNA (adenosine(37)-N6)-threonylcarbamoyltransferase complex ATPase subunit type 1 TsaE [Candidatus Saccharibacteria bacterium]|nr:tRNA (adenosine(37)-N6)-threonylcarbamoyltransferase complex ATPase subunit type 1 TsaE [Candidatus Saccharibacteria bacterium]
MKKQLVTKNLAETIEIGREIGSKLKGGEVIELISDLGGGKTTLTKGIAEGAGSKDMVASPSFTISYLYSAPKFNIHHFDFYRLEDSGVVGLSLAEAISEKNDVIVIEWGDIVADILPESRITIKLSSDAEDENKRIIEVDLPDQLNYLLEDLK